MVALRTLGLGAPIIEVMDLLQDTGHNLTGQKSAGFSDGVFGYLVFRTNGRIARFGLQSFDWRDLEVLNIEGLDSSVKFLSAGFHQGGFGYTVPMRDGVAPNATKFARFSLTEFTPAGVAIYDAERNLFSHGFSDNAYGFFLPGGSGNEVLRFNLGDPSSKQILDMSLTDPALPQFYGGFSDGTYGYCVPSGGATANPKVVRFHQHRFDTVELLALPPERVAQGKWFSGGFSDGRFGYIAPGTDALGGWHGLVVRFDLEAFSSASVETLDLAQVDPSLTGYRGGYVDGGYGYVLPCIGGPNSDWHGKVARFNISSFDVASVAIEDFRAKPEASLVELEHGGFFDASVGRAFFPDSTKVVRFAFEELPKIATSTTSTTTTTTFFENVTEIDISPFVVIPPTEIKQQSMDSKNNPVTATVLTAIFAVSAVIIFILIFLVAAWKFRPHKCARAKRMVMTE